MRVLIGCECSQVICSAFRHYGHEAYSCDLLPSYGSFPEYHIQGDIREVYWKVKPDLFIAHPPCTYLSKAGANLMFPGGELNLERAAFARDAFIFFQWCLSAPSPFVCVENPIPMKFFVKVPYDQIIEPYYFGEPFSKATCLWLRGLPFLVNETREIRCRSSWTSVHKTAKLRSQSFCGIADAMARQWGCLDPKFAIRGFLE